MGYWSHLRISETESKLFHLKTAADGILHLVFFGGLLVSLARHGWVDRLAKMADRHEEDDQEEEEEEVKFPRSRIALGVPAVRTAGVVIRLILRSGIC